MAEYTTNYSLIKLAASEDLSTGDYAFFQANMDIIDRALAQSLSRPGSSATIVSDPTTGLSLTLDDTSGSIPASTTAYYRYSFLDAFGAETAASDISSVTTAAPISAPSAPLISSVTTGGTILPGNYFYVLTAYVSVNTQETTGQNRSNITVPTTTTTNVITLTLPTLPTGADGFNVYRRGPGEAEYSYLTSIDMTVATPPTEYDDDNSTGPNCTRRPPTTTQTSSTNSVEISIPGATPTVDGDAAGWRIYRTYDNTNWGSSLLTTVIEETFEGSGIITPLYTDLGDATTNGSPKESTEQIAGNDPVDLTDMAEVQGYLPPGRNVTPFAFTFAFPGEVAVTTGTFVWRFPFDYGEIESVIVNIGKDELTSGGIVEIDVLKYVESGTPTWQSIFDAATPVLPTIDDGENESTETAPTDGELVAGDKLVCDITDVTTSTVNDLTVTVLMLVRHGSEDVSSTGILGIA